MLRGSRSWIVSIPAVALVSLAACAVAVVSAGAVGAQQTLTGEQLTGTPRITSANCTVTGPSTFSYTVTGVATGPYPGRFTEFGTVETLERTRSVVSRFRAVFAITPDPAVPNPTFERVVGAKTLLAPLSGEADCDSQAFGDVDRFSLFVTHRYSAVIETVGNEACFDEGIGSVQMLLAGTPEGPLAEFREDFTSSLSQAACGDEDDEDDEDDEEDDEEDEGDDDDD
jgi:hypothetical protein